ncbi:hypothetical protein ACVWXO_009104 [Bradyrhizobium sp. LM2.7]
MLDTSHGGNDTLDVSVLTTDGGRLSAETPSVP